MSLPRDHHYAPQFLLRNFAADEAKLKILTVAKSGLMAVWKERSIREIGYEKDFYIHRIGGVPVSVETDINRRIETPISRSDTWSKIESGRSDLLDRSDREVLYALTRHLEARTPHYFATLMELANLASDPASDIPFTDEERRDYAILRANPELAKAQTNLMSATAGWSSDSFASAGIMVCRSPIPLWSSTTPTMVMPAAADPAFALPLPGMTPYQLVLPVNRYTLVSVFLGDFDGGFSNIEVGVDVAHGYNRHRMTQFAHFEHVRHLVADRDYLEAEMTWAPYELVRDVGSKIIFRRRPEASSQHEP